MESVCRNESCTFKETGICVLDNDPKDCPEFIISSEDSPDLDIDVGIDDSSSVVTDIKLPSSLVLGKEDVSRKMSHSYCQLVGILGSPGAGKTAALVSLYLLLAHGKLENFSFRDSDTLMAFEQISQGARRWEEGNPGQELTQRTQMVDERQPGFLQLKLCHNVSTRIFDVILPDLPGEWTTTFVNENRFERLKFLLSCDVIWLVMDGRALREKIKRRGETHRTEVLLNRLVSNFGNFKLPRLMIVVTHKDFGNMEPTALEDVTRIATDLSFAVEVHHIASFAPDSEIVPGQGLSELLSASLESNNTNTIPAWHENSEESHREMLNFRVRMNSHV